MRDKDIRRLWEHGRMAEALETVRVDKWLWAARLIKTRPLAVTAVNGGRVQVNGERVKPAKDVRPGDRVEVTIGRQRLEVIVQGLASQRGPASEAALLYEETDESRAARERELAESRLSGQLAGGGARPTKRDRRRIDATHGSSRGRR
jgi:ribosome-associated heat shock protein Hsp15